jgi:hypothetical protein
MGIIWDNDGQIYGRYMADIWRYMEIYGVWSSIIDLLPCQTFDTGHIFLAMD